MPEPRNELLMSLINLHRLTQAEAMVNQTRQLQARDEAMRRELADNLSAIQERASLLDQQIRRLGGTPDVIGTFLGRLGTTLKATLEQGQTLDEALLGDLTLEHTLYDRATYTKTLARSQNEPAIEALMERLERAHAETIDWLRTRLGEVALGGPAGIRPTPVQRAVGTVRNAVLLPLRPVSQVLNRTLSRAARVPQQAQQVVDLTTDRARQAAEAAGDVAQAGRDAVLRQAEVEAREAGAGRAAGAVREAREDLGALSANELPVPNYDQLSAADAAARVRSLGDPDQVRAILAYENAHKRRQTVVTAANSRIEELARAASS